MKASRKSRDEACQLITHYLDSHPDEAFTANTLGAVLGIGQGRIRGLLPILADEGKIATDGNGHWRSIENTSLPPREVGCADYIRFFGLAGLLFPGAKVKITWPREEEP